MKKIICLAISTMILVGSLSGCLNAQTSQPKATSAPDASAKNVDSQAEADTTVNKDAVVIKISNGAAESHPIVVAEREVFKKMVEKGTQGRYKIEVFHSAQLGDDVKSTEGVRAGTIEMVASSTAPLVGFCKELAVFDIPFLFSNPQQADKVLDGSFGEMLSDKLGEFGVVNLAWCEYGFRNLTNSKRTVTKPEDLAGLKIRTMDNKYHLKTWELLGANPTPMSWAEVFTSLQQKAIDGQENPIAAIYSSQINEVNKYISTTQHVYSPLVFMMSKKVWDKISQEDQKVFSEAAKATAIYGRELNRAEEEKYISEMEKAGAEVTRISDAEKEPFQSRTQPVWDLITESVGQDIIDQLKAALEG